MDRVKKNNVKAKDLALPVLIIGLVVSALLIVFGILRINDLNNQVGTKNLEEINTDITALSEKYQAAVVAENEEYEANGISDEYIELNKHSTELSKEITKLTNSRYMKETGYNNPNSVDKILKLAPTLWLGVICIFVSIGAFLVLKQK